MKCSSWQCIIYPLPHESRARDASVKNSHKRINLSLSKLDCQIRKYKSVFFPHYLHFVVTKNWTKYIASKGAALILTVLTNFRPSNSLRFSINGKLFHIVGRFVCKKPLDKCRVFFVDFSKYNRLTV